MTQSRDGDHAEASEWVGPNDPTVLLVNPQSRRGVQSFTYIRKLLETEVRLVHAAMPAGRAEMGQAIAAGLAQGVRRFIIGGGDGTLSFAANELAGSTGILGVLPVGTGNTFAWGIHLPFNLAELVTLYREGPVQRFDVGVVQSAQGQRVFLNTVTLGVSQALVELLTPEAKRRYGWLAWPFMVRRALAATGPVRITLQVRSGKEAPEEIFWTRQFVLANGRTMAGPIAASPDASAQDGALDIFSLGDPSLAAMLRTAVCLLFGHHAQDRSAHYHRAPEVTFASEPAVALDVDGDIWCHTPVTCRVWNRALRVITHAKRRRFAGPGLTAMTMRPGPQRLAPRGSRATIRMGDGHRGEHW